jgi:predicted site-specific integrase-resolvase
MGSLKSPPAWQLRGALTVSLIFIHSYAIISIMKRLVTISEASEILGVSITTLRRWDKAGRLTPEKTASGHRRYDISKLKPGMYREINKEAKKTIAYARVSSHDQKNDLERQKQVLELYCARQGWTYEIVSDLGSGMNYHKKGLKLLINDILSEKIMRLVITHKDRLLRFGAELIFAICEAKHVEVVILNQGEDTTFEEDLAKDVLEIITVFSARLYGSRSRKNQKLIEDVKKVIEAVAEG